MILVPLLNPKFATVLAEKSCELRVRGTSAIEHSRPGPASPDAPAPYARGRNASVAPALPPRRGTQGTVAMPYSREPEPVSATQVAVHFTIGALLGALGGLYLVSYDWSAVNQMLTAGHTGVPMPAAVFVAICACTIATGASLTGAVFSTLEAERIAEARRRPPPPPRDRG